jgi:hypothetical protein
MTCRVEKNFKNIFNIIEFCKRGVKFSTLLLQKDI